MDSLREIQFTVPFSASYEDQYTIYWGGSSILQHLYTPTGSDIMQLGVKEIYDYFKWGFVHFSFKPTGLATQYSLNGVGVWRIQMKTVDPTTPSLYGSDAFQVSIRRTVWNSVAKDLAVGQSYAIALPLVPDWYTEEADNFYINANSSQIEVTNALLSYSYDSGSYWRPYNHTIIITNKWTTPLSLWIYYNTQTFRLIDYQTNEEGLEFTLNSTVFDRTRDSDYASLDITANLPLNSTLLIPNGTRADSLHRNIIQGQSDAYYTLQVIYGIYRVEFNPYHGSQVLENGMYGTWRLTTQVPEAAHDVAIVNLKPCRTVVEDNCTTRINVTVANQGNFAETFNVTFYANSSTLGTQTLTLDNGQRANLTFVLTTATLQKGNYVLLATASTVLNETNTGNNNATCYIQISIKGDIDASGKVNIMDISAVARIFGTKLGDANWNPNADVNEDNMVNIVDISAVAREFGKTA